MQRAYRREAERLVLWAIVERGKALSSLTTEDATRLSCFRASPHTESPLDLPVSAAIVAGMASLHGSAVVGFHRLRRFRCSARCSAGSSNSAKC
jgi:hypothetical protein